MPESRTNTKRLDKGVGDINSSGLPKRVLDKAKSKIDNGFVDEFLIEKNRKARKKLNSIEEKEIDDGFICAVKIEEDMNEAERLIIMGADASDLWYLAATTQDADYDIKLARLAIRMGVDPNTRTKPLLRTPLHYAILEGNHKIEKMLIEIGADQSIKDKNGIDAKIYAEDKKNLEK